MSQNFPMENPSWDLESIFEGGVESEQFAAEVQWLDERSAELTEEIERLRIASGRRATEEELGRWDRFLNSYFDTWDRLGEALSFARALASAHADDAKAARLPSELDDAMTVMRGVGVDLKARFRGIADEAFEAFLKDERFSRRILWLKELRRDADRAMERDLEALAVELNRDGFHAWGRLYSQMTGRLKVEVEGEEEAMSVAQAKNLMSNADRDRRRAAFEGLQQAWGSVAPTCASILHSVRGTEQTLFKRRKGDYLTEPLFANRVERRSVEAMFDAAQEFRPLLERYLKAKAKLLGLEKLEWFDINAPVGRSEDAHISYTEAQEFIVDQVDRLSPKIADFCRMALSKRWVEAEDRPGKRQGGYCTSLPVSKEFRIFMTFGDNSSSMTTLAHELGHGYHAHVMREMERSETKVPMGLAESASTLLEAIVEQAALEQAEGAQRLSLLDDRLGRAVAFLIDIPARFELEKRMHEARQKSTLHEEMLSEMTAEIFAEHFGEGVSSVDELFWASKLHFYLTWVPFYNFPYTFGYLFSRAVYEQCRREEGEFVDRLDALLRDTGRMTSEEVARKHLDGDLGDRKFWVEAAGDLKADVERFEQAVAEAV